MPNANYPSSSTIVRNLSELQGWFTTEQTGDPFSIVSFPHPGFNGSELWVTNAKGFLWEGFDSLSEAQAFAADTMNQEEAIAA